MLCVCVSNDTFSTNKSQKTFIWAIYTKGQTSAWNILFSFCESERILNITYKQANELK